MRNGEGDPLSDRINIQPVQRQESGSLFGGLLVLVVIVLVFVGEWRDTPARQPAHVWTDTEVAANLAEAPGAPGAVSGQVTLPHVLTADTPTRMKDGELAWTTLDGLLVDAAGKLWVLPHTRVTGLVAARQAQRRWSVELNREGNTFAVDLSDHTWATFPGIPAGVPPAGAFPVTKITLPPGWDKLEGATR